MNYIQSYGLHTESWITYRVMDYIQSHGLHTESWITYRVMDYIQSYGLHKNIPNVALKSCIYTDINNNRDKK